MKKSYLSGLLCICFVLGSVMAQATSTTPVITTPLYNTSVCAGTFATFTINAIDTPGTDSVNTYTWQLDSAGTWVTVINDSTYSGAGTNSLQVMATPLVNGNLYRVIVSDSSGADTSNTAMLTVVSPPVAGLITGPKNVCKGSNISLSDTAAGGMWSSSATAIATVDTAGVVTGVSQGFATIQYSLINICGTDIKYYTVRVDTPVSAALIEGPSVTCVGATIYLTNSNVSGTFTWTASNGHATVNTAGMVTGVSGGRDTITYVFSNACSEVLSSKVITIDTVINPGTISGASVLCAGSETTLSETATGGVWITSSSSASVDGSGNVTGISQGTADISYYQSNVCGASIATHTIGIFNRAAAISGADSVGVGNIIALSDATTGGTWMSSDSAVATVNSDGIVTGIGAGTDTITYSVTNICGTTTATLILNVGTAPSAGIITGRDSICVSSSITLMDSVPGGTWSSQNAYASVSPAGVVTGIAAGIDTIYYTVANSFGTSVTSIVIDVITAPNVMVDTLYPVAAGISYVLVGTPAGGRWTTSNNRVATVFSSHLLAVLRGGTDTITYTVSNMCGTGHSDFIINVANITSGINTLNKGGYSLNIYPNPSKGDFTVNLSSAANEAAKVTIINAAGSVIKEMETATNTNSILHLDVPAGIYFLSATSVSGTYSAKINVIK